MSTTTITVGPFTWRRNDPIIFSREAWTLVLDPDLPATYWWINDYGGEPSDDNGFSGWRFGSGGPFANVGGWTSRDEAMRGVIPWLMDRLRADAIALRLKSERTIAAVRRLEALLETTTTTP